MHCIQEPFELHLEENWPYWGKGKCYQSQFIPSNSRQNKFSDKEAIANQTQGQVEQGQFASLSGENQVSGVEIKAVDEDECSGVSVPNPEKWSHEAIVARANARPERMQKLKVAANLGQNPGFDFLQECWNDDPALQIVINKLLAKFPQWGIAVVDGMLMNWNE